MEGTQRNRNKTKMAKRIESLHKIEDLISKPLIQYSKTQYNTIQYNTGVKRVQTREKSMVISKIQFNSIQLISLILQGIRMKSYKIKGRNQTMGMTLMINQNQWEHHIIFFFLICASSRS